MFPTWFKKNVPIFSNYIVILKKTTHYCSNQMTFKKKYINLLRPWVALMRKLHKYTWMIQNLEEMHKYEHSSCYSFSTYIFSILQGPEELSLYHFNELFLVLISQTDSAKMKIWTSVLKTDIF